MASEQVDGGMEPTEVEAGPPVYQDVDTTSKAASLLERYPSNAILPDRDENDTSSSIVSNGICKAISQDDTSPSLPVILEGEQAEVNNEDGRTQDTAMETGSLSQSITDSPVPMPNEIEESPSTSNSSLYKSATSAAMSSSSSSTVTSSTSSATIGYDPTTKDHHEELNHVDQPAIPSPSDFVQKRDPVNQVPKRQRIPRACDACRRKKIRCNLSTSDSNDALSREQACANCHQSGIHCTFTKTVAKRGPNKGYIQQLESRLAALESSVSSETIAADPALQSSEADHSRTARTYGLLPPAGNKHPSSFSLPPQKKPRMGDTLPPQAHEDYLHPLQILPPSHPFAARTASNETWSRTTAPPTLYSTNSFFLSSNPPHHSSAPGHPPNREQPQNSPPAQAADALKRHPSHSTLPPISRLISTLPPPDTRSWSQRDGPYADNYAPMSLSSQQYSQARDVEPSEARHSAARPRLESDSSDSSARKVPSRQPSYSSAVHYTDYVPPPTHLNFANAGRLHPRDYSSDARNGYRPQPPGVRPTRSPSLGSPASFHQGLPDTSPKSDTRLRWPASSATPSSSPQGSASLLSRLDRSAVLSLDSPAFRRAVFETPAMRTFSILPPALLEEGFQNCQHLIKAAHLLSTSSATLTYTADTLDDHQWECDSSAVIGECMVPMRFDNTGSNMTCREIESLMMCYVDALRRGKLIAGILGAISGKLAILETRGLPCKRYQAVGILLAVWHTVGYSSRRMYFGTPSTSGPDALYGALDTKDPTILAICIFTYNLDKMCRRYCQNGEIYVPPESIEYTRVIAASYPEPLPKAQLRLLSILDSFLLALNFAYNQSLTALPSIEALERQRHHLHSIVNDADSSELLNLLVGPHVLAMVSCAALYCLAACREKGETETDADQKQNIRTLERDYLSILDALRNMTTALSATPDASLVNSHPFADGGDMRLLYAQIARFVKVNLAAAISSSKDQLTASQVIGNLHSMGYLGTVLAASQEPEGSAS